VSACLTRGKHTRYIGVDDDGGDAYYEVYFGEYTGDNRPPELVYSSRDLFDTILFVLDALGIAAIDEDHTLGRIELDKPISEAVSGDERASRLTMEYLETLVESILVMNQYRIDRVWDSPSGYETYVDVVCRRCNVELASSAPLSSYPQLKQAMTMHLAKSHPGEYRRIMDAVGMLVDALMNSTTITRDALKPLRADDRQAQAPTRRHQHSLGYDRMSGML